MSEPPDPATPAGGQDPRPGRWLPRMLVSSAVLVALALGAVLAAPPAVLHWHAWRYRAQRDDSGKSLKYVVDWAVSHRAARREVVKLLGPADTDYLPGVANPDVAEYYVDGTGPSPAGGYSLHFTAGRADSASPIFHGPPNL